MPLPFEQTRTGEMLTATMRRTAEQALDKAGGGPAGVIVAIVMYDIVQLSYLAGISDTERSRIMKEFDLMLLTLIPALHSGPTSLKESEYVRDFHAARKAFNQDLTDLANDKGQ